MCRMARRSCSAQSWLSRRYVRRRGSSLYLVSLLPASVQEAAGRALRLGDHNLASLICRSDGITTLGGARMRVHAPGLVGVMYHNAHVKFWMDLRRSLGRGGSADETQGHTTNPHIPHSQTEMENLSFSQSCSVTGERGRHVSTNTPISYSLSPLAIDCDQASLSKSNPLDKTEQRW